MKLRKSLSFIVVQIIRFIHKSLKASDVAEYIELFGSSTRDCHAYIVRQYTRHHA